MLTDIFARRYENRPLFESVGQRENAFFVQAYRIINEQIFRYFDSDGKVDDSAKAVWTGLHNRITMEIGVKELSPLFYSYQSEFMGKPHTNSGWNSMNYVCEVWLTKAFEDSLDPDLFVKCRLSFVELAFREREQQIALINANLPEALREAAQRDATVRGLRAEMRVPSTTSGVERITQHNDSINAVWQANVNELNERLKQAGMPLNYHGGFVQINTDALTQTQVEKPFWEVLKDPKWKNVSIDMVEALDLRDSGGRDPAFYAGKALESAIKIISAEKKWTTGKEGGASSFLNHFESKANGAFIQPWERQILNSFFSNVRNDYGHGPGSAPMPTMTIPQSDQVIEFCMSWIKSLVKRL
jgi:hypothetical protein